MKKIFSVLMICFVSLITFTNCTSTPKVKDVSGPTEIIEHKGTVFGIAQPDWVSSVVGTPNQKTLSKALGIEKHIWVVTKNGKSLDFIKTWADQVDARAEISASIKQGISDFVGATMEGDKTDVEETIERYSARASAITISGLTKETDWWILSQTKLKKNEKSEPKYTYIVVYSIDEEMYENQIKKAFKDEDDKFVEELIQHLMNYTMIEPRT